MKTIAPDEATEAEESDFEPLTAQQAQEWREHQAPLSVWRLLAGRGLGGAVGAALGRGGGGRAGGGGAGARGDGRNAGGPAGLGVDGPCRCGLVCRLRCAGRGAPGRVVCPRGAAPQGRRRSAGGAAGVRGLGTGQDHADAGVAGCGGAVGAGPELGGAAGGYGERDENVLGGPVGVARCPKNRFSLIQERVVRWPHQRMLRLQVNTSFTTCSICKTYRRPRSSTSRSSTTTPWSWPCCSAA